MELPVLHQPLTIVLLIGLDDGSLDGALRNAGAAALDVINRALVTRLPNASLILRNAYFPDFLIAQRQVKYRTDLP